MFYWQLSMLMPEYCLHRVLSQCFLDRTDFIKYFPASQIWPSWVWPVVCTMLETFWRCLLIVELTMIDLLPQECYWHGGLDVVKEAIHRVGVKEDDCRDRWDRIISVTTSYGSKWKKKKTLRGIFCDGTFKWSFRLFGVPDRPNARLLFKDVTDCGFG